MNSKKRAAALTALLLTCSLFAACGKDSGTSTAPEPAKNDSAAADSQSTEAADERTDESSKDAADSKTDSKSSSGKKSDSSSKTDSKSESKTDSKSSTKSGSKTDSSTASTETPAGNDTASDDSGSAGGNAASDGGSSSGENGGSSGGNTQSGENTQSGSDTSTPAAEDDEDAAKPTKFIELNGTSAKYSGDGIYVDGGNITITKGGTYQISGTLSNGQIYVMTDKKKVKLHLNNASITNHAGSAINCQNAKKLTITSLAGTVNYLEDGGTHDADKGTVFSEDTVVLSGEGELNIKANYAHGVQSDDDIVVNGGTVNITSAKSCLHSNDGIEINGGSLFCDGGTNGIKTDGYITITGGSSIFLGGTREEKGAIYCDGSLTVTGGNFWAIGNTCATPDAATTTANVIGMMFKQAQAANTVVRVTSGANEIFTMTSPRNFKYVVYTGPNLLTNAEYNVSYGGTPDVASENYVYYNANYTGGTDGGSFTAGNTVTFYTVP